MNFRQLGIVEHPWPILWHRLEVDYAKDLPIAEFTRPTVTVSYWTDGSVIWGENFPLTAAGFSVVQEDGQVFASGTVSHLSLSSFSAELWAVIVATLRSDCNVHIFSDCKEVVRKVNTLVETFQLPHNCLHLEWWKTLRDVVLSRGRTSLTPAVQMTWIHAHIADGIPVSLIPPSVLSSAGTTRKNVELNRIADQVAKQSALSRCAIHPADKDPLQQAILKQRQFLTDLNKFIGYECADTFTDRPMQQRPMNKCDFRGSYPGFAWTVCEEDFTFVWVPPQQCSPPQTGLGPQDWDTFLAFVPGLKWMIDDSVHSTYQEIAFLFHHRGFRLSDRPNHFQELVLRLRKCIVSLGRSPFALPGKPTARAYKCIGKVLPQGAIVGALPFFAKGELLAFCSVLASGAGRSAESWSFPFDRLLYSAFIDLSVVDATFQPTGLSASEQNGLLRRSIYSGLGIWVSTHSHRRPDGEQRLEMLLPIFLVG